MPLDTRLLEQALGKFFVKKEAAQLQKAVGEDALINPIHTVRYAAGAAVTWQQIQIKAYEMLVLPGDDTVQLGDDPCYVMFGTDGPTSTTGTTDAGAFPLTPGSRVRIPQGVKKVWFLATNSTASWRVVFVKIPEAHIEYGPYGQRLGESILSQDVLAVSVTDPSTTAHGVAVPEAAKRCTIQLLVLDTGVYSRVAMTFDAEIWWLQSNEAPQLWAHNSSDDFTGSGLGQAGVDHDAEGYGCGAMQRVAVVTSATPASGDYVALITWIG